LGTDAWPERVCYLCASSIRRWGKDKLVGGTRPEKCHISPYWWDASWSIGSGRGWVLSTKHRQVGRMSQARRNGGNCENGTWAIARPKYGELHQPGDLVEIDTKESRMRRGVTS